MATIGGSPYVELAFDKAGNLSAAQRRGLTEALAQPKVSDLVVLSHGWLTEAAGARGLYRALWVNVEKRLDKISSDQIAVVGVLWPSKAYRTDFDQIGQRARACGGAAGVRAGGRESRDLGEAQFEELLADAVAFLGEAGLADAARDAASGGAALPLFQTLRSAASVEARRDSEVEADAKLLDLLTEHDAANALAGLELPTEVDARAQGGTESMAETAPGTVNGLRAAVAQLLNLSTFFAMKARAGVIGEALGRELSSINSGRSVRLHLIGHSFGARLVTAAAQSFRAGSLSLHSLTLLQGAFSHHGLMRQYRSRLGPFPDVVGKPSGPIAITHTHNDLAVKRWYAVAARLGRDVVQAMGGGRNDPHGAIGANGALGLVASAYAPPFSNSTGFAPVPGLVNNFRADNYIAKTSGPDGDIDAHSNVTNPSCGELVAAVLQA